MHMIYIYIYTSLYIYLSFIYYLCMYIYMHVILYTHMYTQWPCMFRLLRISAE